MTSRNIKLTIAFDGTQYSGWQRQPDQSTIQGELEKKIAVMTREEIVLHGAGRTDAGVHALGMVANFTTGAQIPCPGFMAGLNSLLEDDIRILAVEEVDTSFHARRSATGKCYFYRMDIGGVMLPTRRLYSTHVKTFLDVGSMEKCLPFILGRHDFSSFEAAGSRDPALPGRGAVREIFSASFQRTDATRLCFTIHGDGFLRHMVRNIIGTLLEIGKARLTVNGFRDIVTARDRSAAGPTAPASGLFLREVFY